MNFQQLRSIREAARNNYNLTEVASVLFTSQPAISRQIRELEEELGVEIFTRAGKRLTGLTTPGKTLLPIDRLLLEAGNLKNAGKDFKEKDTGVFYVAATHSQARYALPAVVRDFRQIYPASRCTCARALPSRLPTCC
jgi:LysR family cys regulon transcriptional activator